MYDEVSGFSEWMASLGSGSKAAIRCGLRQRPLCGTKRAAGITGFLRHQVARHCRIAADRITGFAIYSGARKHIRIQSGGIRRRNRHVRP